MELQGFYYKQTTSAKTGYIRLFRLSAPSSGGTIFISRGHNNTYTSGNPNTTADITIFRWGYYPVSGESKIIMRELIPYGNTIFGNTGFRLFIGYELDDDNNKLWGIYTDFIDTFELYLYPSETGYGIKLNVEYDFKEITDTSSVTKYTSGSYTDRLLKLTTNTGIITTDFFALNFNDAQVAFTCDVVIRNFRGKIRLDVPRAVGYVSRVTDADGNAITNDNGYDITNVRQPLKIVIFCDPSATIRNMASAFYTIGIKDVYEEEILNIPLIVVNTAKTVRPTENLSVGQMCFDKTLNKPIWIKEINNNVATWVDATGTTV